MKPAPVKFLRKVASIPRLWRFFAALLIVPLLLYSAVLWLFADVEAKIGPPSEALNPLQRLVLTIKMARNLDELTHPTGGGRSSDSSVLRIASGESASQIAEKLSENGLLSDSSLFIDYLIYSGADRRLKPGSFVIPPNSSIPALTAVITSAENSLIRFSILPGMRLEEIAALIPTSGFLFTAEEFLSAAVHWQPDKHPAGGTSLEGFLMAGTYEINRTIALDAFLDGFVNVYKKNLTAERISALSRKGLSLMDSATLASMITREAMAVEEYELVASVFLNRLRAGIQFQSDPTVQYAIGWDAPSASWWKNPLTRADLDTPSPFNTYVVNGFPPHPIGSFSLSALEACINAPETEYFYFRLKCDGTPYHQFAVTYQEHLQNACSAAEKNP